MNLTEKLRTYPVQACLHYISILPWSMKTKLLCLSMLNLLLAALDLVGLVCLGLATVRGLGNSPKEITLGSNWLVSSVNFFNGMSTLKLFLISVSVFLCRNILTLLLTKALLFQVSNHQKQVSHNLFKRHMNNKFQELRSLTQQEVLDFFTDSMNSATMGLLANSVLAFSEILLLLVFVVFLLTFNFSIGLFITMYFGIIFIMLQKVLGTRASSGLDKFTKEGIAMRTFMSDVLPTRTEIILAGKQKSFASAFQLSKNLSSDLYSAVVLYGQYPKFVLEFTVIFGGSILAAWQLLAYGTDATIALLAIYVGLALRVLPVLMRLQSYLINTFSSFGYSQTFLTTIFQMKANETLGGVFDDLKVSLIAENFGSDRFRVLSCKNITFQYPLRNWILGIPEFSVQRLETVAIMGASGSGKSTFNKILLGDLSPQSGLLEINETPISTWVEKFPGSIAYVPQNPVLISGTFKENVALGVSLDQIDLDLMVSCLQKSQLLDFVDGLEHKGDTNVKFLTETLSGGQKQRLAIARALYTKPSLIIFDEPTSSLDVETEEAIIDSLQILKHSCSIIIVTHNQRIAEIADVIYEMKLENGVSNLVKIDH